MFRLGQVWRKQVVLYILFKPLVLYYLVYRDTVQWVYNQHPRKKTLGTFRQVVGERVDSVADLPEQCWNELVVKGQPSAKHHVQNNPGRPHIHLRTRVKLTTDNLRRSVVGRPATGLQKITVRHDIRQPKIGNLHIQVVVQKQVLWLQVSVHNLVSMTVFHCSDNLLEKPSGFILRHLSPLHNVVKELLARVLNHHDDFVPRFDHVVELDDMWVP